MTKVSVATPGNEDANPLYRIRHHRDMSRCFFQCTPVYTMRLRDHQLARRPSQAEGGSFLGVEVAPAAGGEVAQDDRADGDADEAQGRVADGGGHAADLAVAALAEGQAEPG